MATTPSQRIEAMNRPVKLWEAITGLIAIIIGLGTVVYNTGTRDGDNKAKFNYIQLQLDEQKTTNAKILQNQDDQGKDIRNILIELQNKENRRP